MRRALAFHACKTPLWPQETGRGPLEASSQRLWFNPAFAVEGSSLSEADLAPAGRRPRAVPRRCGRPPGCKAQLLLPGPPRMPSQHAPLPHAACMQCSTDLGGLSEHATVHMAKPCIHMGMAHACARH